MHTRCYPVRRENHGRALGHFIQLINEDGTAPLKILDNMLVVNDLLTHINRGSVEFKRLFDGHHRAVDTGAIAAWGRQQNLLRRVIHPSIVRGRG